MEGLAYKPRGACSDRQLFAGIPNEPGAVLPGNRHRLEAQHQQEKLERKPERLARELLGLRASSSGRHYGVLPTPYSLLLVGLGRNNFPMASHMLLFYYSPGHWPPSGRDPAPPSGLLHIKTSGTCRSRPAHRPASWLTRFGRFRICPSTQ